MSLKEDYNKLEEQLQQIQSINANLHLIIEEYRDLVDRCSKNDNNEMFKYYNGLACELTSRISNAIKYMENYIKVECGNHNVKCEFEEVIKILKGEDN